MQTAGYQAILQGHVRGYRPHILVEGKWTIWHGTTRQGAFPPHVDWRQALTQAYYMAVDPWPLAVLLHTISTPSTWQEPGWPSPPPLVWSPDQGEHVLAAWHSDAIRITDVPDLHKVLITHARRAATLAVAQRGQQSPKWVVCMFSPADTHIAICNPKRLPEPEAVICVADCACLIVKALQEGDYHALPMQAHLKDHTKAAQPGVWLAAAIPADLKLLLAVPPTVYSWHQVLHNLRWRGKPDRQIGATHWQQWLQADTQHATIRGLGPVPTARAPDASAPGCTLAAHGPAGQPALQPRARELHLQVVAAPSAEGGHGTHKLPLVCRQVLQKWGDAGIPGVARGARCRPGGRQGSGLPHLPRMGMEISVAPLLRPAPPSPRRPTRRRFWRRERGQRALLPSEEPLRADAELGVGVALRRLKLHDQNVPKTASPWHSQIVVLLGDPKKQEPKIQQKAISWTNLIFFEENRLPGKVIYLPKNALLFAESHDFLFPLPLMLSHENTHEVSIFWKNQFPKTVVRTAPQQAFFGTPSWREASRKHQHNSAIKCITGKKVPRKVTAKRSSKRNA